MIAKDLGPKNHNRVGLDALIAYEYGILTLEALHERTRMHRALKLCSWRKHPATDLQTTTWASFSNPSGKSDEQEFHRLLMALRD